MRTAAAVFEYHLAGYRRVWRSALVASLNRPVLFFLGMGLVLGAYVDRTGNLNVPYLHFIAPGLCAFSGLEIAVAESSFPVLTAFKWQKIYAGMAAAPVRVLDMVVGRLAYVVVVRVAVAAVAFLLVMLVFGVVGSPWALAMPLLAGLVGLAGAAPMLAFAATVDSLSPMAIVVRFGMLPIMLFSGVFFPISQIPLPFRTVAYVLPLWHGVELARAATLGVRTQWLAPVHVAVLLLWFVAGFVLAVVRFRQRLTD